MLLKLLGVLLICQFVNGQTTSCLSTVIDLQNNKTLRYCGVWLCAGDNYQGKKIPVCTLLGGPRIFTDCIQINEERVCGTFRCTISTPYLHPASCQEVKSVGNLVPLVPKSLCFTPNCPKCPTCPPIITPTCPPYQPCDCPVQNCPTCRDRYQCFEEDYLKECGRPCYGCANCGPCPVE